MVDSQTVLLKYSTILRVIEIKKERKLDRDTSLSKLLSFLIYVFLYQESVMPKPTAMWSTPKPICPLTFSENSDKQAINIAMKGIQMLVKTLVKNLSSRWQLTWFRLTSVSSQSTAVWKKNTNMCYLQSNFNGSNIFGTIENCSRHG